MAEVVQFDALEQVPAVVVDSQRVAANGLCAWCTDIKERPVPAAECHVRFLHGTSTKE